MEAQGKMVDHVANRDIILDQLRRELVGPAPAGKQVDANGVLSFQSWDEYEGPYCQAPDSEEVLVGQTPTQRYGVGVLYPQNEEQDQQSQVMESASALVDGEAVDSLDLSGGPGSHVEGNPSALLREDDASADLDLSAANSLSPSSMAISFLADLCKESRLVICAAGGRYAKKDVAIREPGKKPGERTIWLRTPVELSVEIPASDLLLGESKVLSFTPIRHTGNAVVRASNTEGIELSIEILTRSSHDSRQRLLTVCLVNRTVGGRSINKNEKSLFQAHFKVCVENGDLLGGILPYPIPAPIGDDEQLSQEMMYRDIPVFATGHGCAADWGDTITSMRADWVSAECLPVVTLRPITPDILRQDGKPLMVGMGALCTLQPGDSAWGSLNEVVTLYEQWIEAKKESITSDQFPPVYQDVARMHLLECQHALNRMKKGLAYLRDDPKALFAFRLANEAMLRQQVASRAATRAVSFDPKDHRIVADGEYWAPDARPVHEGKGSWRAFQVAFLLSSVEAMGNHQSEDHEMVDLIWFPTGGGKTEAYLGLAAYSMFLRRLEDPQDIGVNVLMRYTLRLLTTQQFERAASLICAMERIRVVHQEDLGPEEFSIGIWLGGDTTPNNRDNARAELKQFRENRNEDNPFLINRCPWCGASMGRIEVKSKGKKATGSTPGYREDANPNGEITVVIHCPDASCPFHDRLPLLVIDEDLYATPPSLVIGTVDKFARLAWDVRPRRLFGIGSDGSRIMSPPQLIIQDELHLISGPLGSLSGLLEPIIEELCTDYRPERPVRPKIVCSTATTRRYQEQVLGLYGRERVCLFPPPGLEAGDSFFARYDTAAPGRKYVGVHAPGFGSYQTEWVRALTALVHAPMDLDTAGERDPWWTLLVFCNSLRDMGTAHTLLNTDVRDYSIPHWQRKGTAKDRKRYISSATSVLELTGGLRRTQIKAALDALNTEVGSANATVDVCLATNIIEVGVDIQRLSLMAVAGQPKTTAQYIQATGRVGRSVDKPGLVVTLYGPSKPRDRSHFEKFRSYHERLYAQVEPSSVTPFSPPALMRALHSSLVAYVRQNGAEQAIASPMPVPDQLLKEAIEILRARLEVVDKDELPNFDAMVDQRLDEWSRWKRQEWEKSTDGEFPLLRHAGAYASPDAKAVSWSTMDSLRNVDSECHGEITRLYLNPTASIGAGYPHE